MQSYQYRISHQRSSSEQFCNYGLMKMSEISYSKGMRWIDSQSKRLMHLKYLILETVHNTIFSIFSWHFIFMYTVLMKK